MTSPDLAATYAALILADDGIEITADKIIALTGAANVELEPVWATLLAQTLEGKDVKELLLNVGSRGSAPGGGGAGAVKAPKEDEKEGEEEGESDDDDMCFCLWHEHE